MKRSKGNRDSVAGAVLSLGSSDSGDWPILYRPTYLKPLKIILQSSHTHLIYVTPRVQCGSTPGKEASTVLLCNK